VVCAVGPVCSDSRRTWSVARKVKCVEICKRRRPNHTALGHFQRDVKGIGMFKAFFCSADASPDSHPANPRGSPKVFGDASCMRCLRMWNHGTVCSQSSSLPPPCARSLPFPTEGRGTAAALSGRSPLSLSQPHTRFETRQWKNKTHHRSRGEMNAHMWQDWGILLQPHLLDHLAETEYVLVGVRHERVGHVIRHVGQGF